MVMTAALAQTLGPDQGYHHHNTFYAARLQLNQPYVPCPRLEWSQSWGRQVLGCGSWGLQVVGWGRGQVAEGKVLWAKGQGSGCLTHPLPLPTVCLLACYSSGGDKFKLTLQY